VGVLNAHGSIIDTILSAQRLALASRAEGDRLRILGSLLVPADVKSH
jgi:hypothetical protein